MPDSISDTHFLRRGACNPLYFRQQTQSLIGGKNAITRRGKSVNIFYKGSYRVTALLSMLCKTYCFALQKSRFRNAKAQVPLFKDFIFTKLEGFGGVCLRGF